MKKYHERKSMGRIALFTDASLNTKLNTGFGAYLMIPESRLSAGPDDLFEREVKLKKFKSASSTKLEIETLLWALKEAENKNKKIDLSGNLTIYTDSQCIAGLPGRREKLERSDFKNAGKNMELNNAILYREFYRFSDRLRFELIKLKGHTRSFNKDILHKKFSFVDKGSRKALKAYVKNNSIPIKNEA